MKGGAEAVAACQTPIVVEHVVVEHTADSGASNRSGRAAEQTGDHRTGQSAEHRTYRSADCANGCASFSAGQRHGKTTRRARDAADRTAGLATDIERFNTR
ncbi:hypothetical protein WQ49_33720 [Burkholderia cenocepacia]|nr:hypothetical protein WQ49_33720 [Burkholderia cenocepacia]